MLTLGTLISIFWKPIRKAYRALLNEIGWRFRPLVYHCKREDLEGLVRARDFNRTMVSRWRYCESDWESRGTFLRFQLLLVDPVLIFSNTLLEDHFTGNLEDMKALLAGCRVEERRFYIPARWDLDSSTYSLAEARKLIYRGKKRPFLPNPTKVH